MNNRGELYFLFSLLSLLYVDRDEIEDTDFEVLDRFELRGFVFSVLFLQQLFGDVFFLVVHEEVLQVVLVQDDVAL